MKIHIAWSVSDELWSKVEPCIPAQVHVRLAGRVYLRADGGGRKPVDARRIFSSILYVLRNQLAWRATPKALGSISTLHRYFVTWKKSGFFAHLYRLDLANHAEFKGVRWSLLFEPDQRPAAPPPAARPERPEADECEPSILDPMIQSKILTLHGSTEVSAFWSATQAILRDAVPNHSSIAYLDFLDHPKTWKAAQILSSPNADMPADWFERRWKMDFTTPFMHSHQGIKVFRFSDIIPDPSELHQLGYFKEFFEPYGWHYVAVLSFWNGAQLSSTVAMRRTKDQGEFTPAEIEFLKKLHPHINTVLRRLIPSHKDQAKLHWLMESAQDIPDALMFLDWKLELLHGNSEALTQCAIWNFGPQKARAYNAREVFSLPAEIVRACMVLKVDWLGRVPPLLGGKKQTLAVKLLHVKDNRRVAKISLVSASREAIFKPSFRIQFECHTADLRPIPDTNQNGALWRLTAAERDILELASTGCNNGEIAAQLHKSVNTVKHQLTSIYSKLGIEASCRRRVFFGQPALPRRFAIERPMSSKVRPRVSGSIL